MRKPEGTESWTVKVSELSTSVTKLLRVSKSILDNVIFCHQEDSYWPLGDASVLKDKFGAIFEASRYAKALKEIQKQKREHSALEKQAAEHRKVTAERLATFQGLEARRDEAIRSEEQYTEALNEASAASTAAKDRAAQLQRQLDASKHLVQKVETAEAGVQRASANVTQAEANLKASVSAEDFAVLLTADEATVESNADQVSTQLAAAVHKQQEAQAALERARETESAAKLQAHTAAERARGLEEQVSALAAKEARLIEVASSGSRKHELPGWPPTIASPLTAEVLNRLRTSATGALEAAQDALTATDRAGRAAASAAHADLATARADLAAAERTRAAASSERDVAAKELQALRLQAGTSDSQSSQQSLLETAEAELAAARQSEASAAAASASSGHAAAISSLSEALRDTRQQLSEARDRVRQAQQASEVAMRQESIRQDAVESRKAAWAALAECAADLSTVLPATPLPAAPSGLTDAQWLAPAAGGAGPGHIGPSNALQLVTERRAAVAGRATAARDALQAAHNAASKARAEVVHAKDRAQDLREALLSMQRSLPDECLVRASDASSGEPLEPSAFVDGDSVLESAREALDTAQANLAMARSGGAFLQRLRAASVKKHACKLCGTHMEGGSGDDMLRVMDALIAKNTARDVAEEEANVAEASDMLQVMTEAATTLGRYASKWQEWQDSLGALDAAVAADKDCTGAVQRAEAAAADAKQTEAACEALLSKVYRVDSSWRAGEAKLAQVSSQPGEGSASLDTARAAVARLEQEEQRLDGRLATARAKADAEQERVQQARQAAHAAQSRVLQLKSSLAGAAQAEADVKRVQQSLERLEAKLRDASAAVGPLAARTSEATAAAKQAQQRADSDRRAAEAKAAALDTFSRELSVLVSSVQELGRQDLRQRHADAQASRRAAQAALEDAQRALAAANDAATTAATALSSMKRMEAGLLALRSLIRARHEKSDAEQEVARLQAELSEAVGQEGDIKRQLQEALSAAEAASLQEGVQQGRLEEVQRSLQAVRVELAAPKFADVVTAHHKAMVDQVSLRLVTRDLDRYYKAVERALAKYHASKMANINEEVARLWRATYCGEDIECIQLRADAEEERGAASKSFKYRVVMKKGATELNMRGRCSAGQKVLASLVIRLALATSFSTHCQFITLDEPTTNLDVQNRAGLARAICRLVASRQHQHKFRLVLITHDEEFVTELVRQQVVQEEGGPAVSLTPSFLRVRRVENAARQHVSDVVRVTWS